jgi:hypothetical protein
MVTIRKAIAVAALVLATALIPSQVALAANSGADSGTITWSKQREYWPSESQARYWIIYPEVDIKDLRPGASNEFRLTIGNQTDKPLTFAISVLMPKELKEGYKAFPNAKWISLTPEASDEPSKVQTADLITIDGKMERHIWVHVDVPRENKWRAQKWECIIRVTEANVDEGPDSVLTVSTDDSLSGAGEKNAPVILGTLLGFTIIIGGAVYAFSRWRWPDEPRVNNNKKAEETSATEQA